MGGVGAEAEAVVKLQLSAARWRRAGKEKKCDKTTPTPPTAHVRRPARFSQASPRLSRPCLSVDNPQPATTFQPCEAPPPMRMYLGAGGRRARIRNKMRRAERPSRSLRGVPGIQLGYIHSKIWRLHVPAWGSAGPEADRTLMKAGSAHPQGTTRHGTARPNSGGRLSIHGDQQSRARQQPS